MRHRINQPLLKKKNKLLRHIKKLNLMKLKSKHNKNRQMRSQKWQKYPGTNLSSNLSRKRPPISINPSKASSLRFTPKQVQLLTTYQMSGQKHFLTKRERFVQRFKRGKI